jgi:metal-responsive CopG/Arc/MetJ family transcriptional regulator
MILGMSSTKLSVSMPSELLDRADQLLRRPGEGRSALIARVLTQAVRIAEEAEIDAAYDRALSEYPVTAQKLDRTNAFARAAVRSTRSLKRKRGAAL